MQVRLHNCQKKNPVLPAHPTPTPRPPKNPQYLSYLKPIFPPQVNPFEPTLYKGQAKKYPGEQIDIKVGFDIFRFRKMGKGQHSFGRKKIRYSTLPSLKGLNLK